MFGGVAHPLSLKISALSTIRPPPVVTQSTGDADSDEVTTHIDAARQAIQRHDFDRAEEELRRALALDERQPATHNLLGVLHEVRGDRRKAQNSYRDALNLDERYAPARFNLRQSVEAHDQRSFMLAEMKRPDDSDKWSDTDWYKEIKK